MASLYKIRLKDGGWTYMVNFTFRGQRFRKSCKTANHKIACQIRDDLAARVARGTFRVEEMNENDISIKEFTELYIDTHSKVDKSPGTTVLDERALNRLMDFVGPGTTLRHISQSRAEKFRIMLKTKGFMKEVPRLKGARPKGPLGPTTINMDFRALKAAFNWALEPERRYVDFNPFDKIRQLRVDERRPRYMTPEELRKLLDTVKAAKHKHARQFEVYLRTLLLIGSRRTETLELRWGQVDLENRYLAFEKTKNDDFRTVPMNDELCDLLRRLKPADAKPNDLLFTYAKQSASRAFKQYAKQAGLPSEIHLHGTRHTYATLQLSDGVPLGALKDILGHHKIETTMQYAKILPDALRVFTNAMSLKRFETKSKEPIDKP